MLKIVYYCYCVILCTKLEITYFLGKPMSCSPYWKYFLVFRAITQHILCLVFKYSLFSIPCFSFL